MYLLRRPLDRTDFVATTVLFFAVVNWIKVIPYAALGQFDATNLATSAVLAPLAPVSIYAGVWLVRVIRPDVFYRLAYALIFMVSLKLIHDGVMASLGV